MINKLMNYVRNETFPVSTISQQMDCSNIIRDYNDRNIGDYILKYHNEKIAEITNECYENIKNLSDIDFIVSFIEYTERLKYFICCMSRTFSDITHNHIRAAEDKNNIRIYNQDDISEFSMDIYKNYFFDKLQDKLFKILNEFLIREERNGNIEYRQKIDYLIKTISDMDIIKPKIYKSRATTTIWEEKGKDIPNPPLTYQKKWYEKFLEETVKYIQNKSKIYSNNSVKEFIKYEIKYINEERERISLYINKKFRDEIINAMYKCIAEAFYNDHKEYIKKAFESKEEKELSDIYKLFHWHTEGVEILKDEIKEYINNCGNNIFKTKEILKDSIKIIPAIINFKREIDDLVKSCFDNNKDLLPIINEELTILM